MWGLKMKYKLETLTFFSQTNLSCINLLLRFGWNGNILIEYNKIGKKLLAKYFCQAGLKIWCHPQ